jgi:Domain of unknown function (DUF6538)
MMLPQCSHITRKRGVYYYRRRLPGATKSEIALSLRTRMFREAQWVAAKLDQGFREVIAKVSKSERAGDIQRIAREYLKNKLRHDMEQREASSHRAVYNVYSEPGRSSTGDLEWVEAELETAKTELRERLYDHQRPLIDEIMEDVGQRLPFKQASDRQRWVHAPTAALPPHRRTLARYPSEGWASQSL